ncbi:MAG: GWxTD domain-containing protein [Candidatus Acidiferrales bacterium]
MNRVPAGCRRSYYCALLLMALFALPGVAAAQKKAKLAPDYRDWLEKQVVYIISKDEREEFVKLPSDEARDKFIQEFWEIRNPSPGSETNTYKEEIYKRIAFANSRFEVGSGTDGWRTARGRTYITLGAPQQKQLYRNAANLRPIEVWFYANVHPALPSAFYVMFFDRDNTGDYRFYSPYFDGPDKLTTGVEAINSPAAGLHMIMSSVGGELARQSLSLIVGEPVDLSDPKPSLQSDVMLTILKSLADQPSYRDDIKRKRMNREQVNSSMILQGHNLDVILLPARDARGLTRLDYSIRLKNPSDLNLSETPDAHLAYSLQIRVQVFDSSNNKLIFTHQKELRDTFDKGRYRDIKDKAFSFEGMLPLPPGEYRLAFQFTDWNKNASYRTEREVSIPKVEAGKFVIPGILPFSSAQQVDPFAAAVLPFTLAGVQFTPLSTSNLALSTDQKLQVAYQIWTSPKNPELAEGKRLQIEYGIGQPALPGSAKSIEDVVDLSQFDSGGSLVNGKKLDLNEEIGNYMLSITIGGSTPETHSYAKINLKVVDSSYLPAAPWLVVDSTIRDDMEKGVFDRERGLAHLNQGQTTEGRGWLRRALSANHGDEMARTRLVEAYFSQQDYAAVVALYRETGVTESADANTLLRIATSLLKQKNETEGLSVLEHGAEVHSGDPAMYVALADFYTQIGNPAKASTALQRSKELVVPN